jgi:AbrB family looped-hinge helix DNA binding protein
VFVLSAEEVEFTVYVRRNGRVTVPKEVRDALDIKKGNLVKCKIKKVNMR